VDIFSPKIPLANEKNCVVETIDADEDILIAPVTLRIPTVRFDVLRAGPVGPV
jgi:hypothetical protein